jgi:prephenate dehydratase
MHTQPAGPIKIGIQGGKGSFNEEACRTYCKNNFITDYEIVYLYTSDRVLKALEAREVDFGVAAIENSLGGLVWETIHALSEFDCRILSNFQIVINHALLGVRGVTISEIDTIMSHPQALAQTKGTLARLFPHTNLVSGEGILVDQATAAAALSKGELPRSSAVIASRVCADLFGLDILAEGLQDMAENLTTFLWMEPR